MLQAALVSWAVTRVMDTLFSILKAVTTRTWGNAMKYVENVIVLAATLVVSTCCSSAVVAGVYLEWLDHVTRAVGIVVTVGHCKRTPLQGLALTASHSAICIVWKTWSDLGRCGHISLRRAQDGLRKFRLLRIQCGRRLRLAWFCRSLVAHYACSVRYVFFAVEEKGACL